MRRLQEIPICTWLYWSHTVSEHDESDHNGVKGPDDLERYAYDMVVVDDLRGKDQAGEQFDYGSGNQRDKGATGRRELDRGVKVGHLPERLLLRCPLWRLGRVVGRHGQALLAEADHDGGADGNGQDGADGDKKEASMGIA